MLERARELGFRTFLGCMEETSIGIAASAAVAPLADWVDLDGCLLLAEDPVEGLELGADKRWVLPDSPGLGLRWQESAAADGVAAADVHLAMPRSGGPGSSRPQLCRRRGPCPPIVSGCGQVGTQHGGEAPTEAPAQDLPCADRR